MTVGLHEGVELLHRLAGLAFLIMGKADGDHDHEADNRGGGRITGEQGDNRDDEELDDQGVTASQEDLHDNTVLFLHPKVVGPPLGAQPFNLVPGEALLTRLHHEEGVFGLLAADLQQSLLVVGDALGSLLLCLGKIGRRDLAEKIFGHG